MTNDYNDIEIKFVTGIAAMAAEYRRITLLPELNDEDEKTMTAIIAFSQLDERLECLLAEIDEEIIAELEEEN